MTPGFPLPLPPAPGIHDCSIRAHGESAADRDAGAGRDKAAERATCDDGGPNCGYAAHNMVLVRHACGFELKAQVAAVENLFDSEGPTLTLAAVVDALGSRAGARFAVLQLAGAGRLSFDVDGRLGDDTAFNRIAQDPCS